MPHLVVRMLCLSFMLTSVGWLLPMLPPPEPRPMSPITEVLMQLTHLMTLVGIGFGGTAIFTLAVAVTVNIFFGAESDASEPNGTISDGRRRQLINLDPVLKNAYSNTQHRLASAELIRTPGDYPHASRRHKKRADYTAATNKRI